MTRSRSKDIFENACRRGLENAKQLLTDSKLLMCSKSYGHAIALAVSSDEELAKAFTCWFVAEGFIPEESKAVEHAFSKHDVKHSTQIAIHFGMLLQSELREGKISLIDILKKGMKLTEKQLAKDIEKLQRIAEERESLR